MPHHPTTTRVLPVLPGTPEGTAVAAGAIVGITHSREGDPKPGHAVVGLGGDAVLVVHHEQPIEVGDEIYLDRTAGRLTTTAGRTAQPFAAALLARGGGGLDLVHLELRTL